MKTKNAPTTGTDSKATATPKRSRADRPKLEPITIVIRDQDELRRIHRIAKHEGRKPQLSAQCSLRMGTWDALRAWKETANYTIR